MRVYIVVESDGEYWQIKGVFDSRAKAEEFISIGEGLDRNNYYYPIVAEEVE